MSTQELEVQSGIKTSPPYHVLLHNDEVNEYTFVISSVIKSIGYPYEKAVKIVEEAHTTGVALVITCMLEHAELYRGRLASFGLTTTIEPAPGG